MAAMETTEQFLGWECSDTLLAPGVYRSDIAKSFSWPVRTPSPVGPLQLPSLSVAAGRALYTYVLYLCVKNMGVVKKIWIFSYQLWIVRFSIS
jgi:hypothetical protein